MNEWILVDIFFSTPSVWDSHYVCTKSYREASQKFTIWLDIVYEVSNLEQKKDKIDHSKKTYEIPDTTESMLHVQQYGSTLIQELSFSYLWNILGCH